MSSTPARLGRKVSKEEDIEAWIINHAHIFLPICILILVILFILLMYAIVGVSATESGVHYNHFQDVI